jgi:hypothetical protein
MEDNNKEYFENNLDYENIKNNSTFSKEGVMGNKDTPNENNNIPDEFKKVLNDFINDLSITFPEYIPLINKIWKSNINDNEYNYIYLFEYCKRKLPPRFFDILYENNDIFNEESTLDTEFLPAINFKNLMNSDISDKSRETIWKYLQLILFSIVSGIENKEAFGDSAKLFEAINQDDFKSKLEETLNSMQELFSSISNNNIDGSCENNETNNNDIDSNTNQQNEKHSINELPSIDEINQHITGLLDGKLGKLAREIAEETAGSLNMDFEDITTPKDIFNKLIKDPTKLLDLVKSVGSKLDNKIKSGEIKESEMLAEATELMNKMKNIPGMGNLQSMLNKMGMGDIGKVNSGAMKSKLDRKMKLAKTKERIKAKAQANAQARALAKEEGVKWNEEPTKIIKNSDENISNIKKIHTDEELIKLFSNCDPIQRSPRQKKKN